jgi:predicted molibdopterin-dependent oxidoreductase YjgC
VHPDPSRPPHRTHHHELPNRRKSSPAPRSRLERRAMTNAIRVVVDGRVLRVTAGSTLLRVARRLSERISPLCIGKLPCLEDCCGLCVVEVEGEVELKRACSQIVERPMSCETYTRRIRRERRRILSALLSKHRRRCPKCASRRKCALLSLAREYDVTSDDSGIGKRETRGPK